MEVAGFDDGFFGFIGRPHVTAVMSSQNKLDPGLTNGNRCHDENSRSSSSPHSDSGSSDSSTDRSDDVSTSNNNSAYISQDMTVLNGIPQHNFGNFMPATTAKYQQFTTMTPQSYQMTSPPQQQQYITTPQGQYLAASPTAGQQPPAQYMTTNCIPQHNMAAQQNFISQFLAQQPGAHHSNQVTQVTYSQQQPVQQHYVTTTTPGTPIQQQQAVVPVVQQQEQNGGVMIFESPQKLQSMTIQQTNINQQSPAAGYILQPQQQPQQHQLTAQQPTIVSVTPLKQCPEYTTTSSSNSSSPALVTTSNLLTAPQPQSITQIQVPAPEHANNIIDTNMITQHQQSTIMVVQQPDIYGNVVLAPLSAGNSNGSDMEADDNSRCSFGSIPEITGAQMLMGQQGQLAITPVDDSPSFGCEICGAEFLTRVLLGSHMQKAHQMNLGREKKDRIQRCRKCGVSFSTKEQLQSHIQQVHSTGSDDGHDPKQTAIPCPICGKEYSRHYYKSHMDYHAGKRYTCEICGIEFPYRRKLQRHKKFHDTSNEYQCPFSTCDMSFNSEISLKKHKKQQHK